MEEAKEKEEKRNLSEQIKKEQQKKNIVTRNSLKLYYSFVD